jgi:hypothetical protein
MIFDFVLEVFSFVVGTTDQLSLFALFCGKSVSAGLSMLVCVFDVIFRR